MFVRSDPDILAARARVRGRIQIFLQLIAGLEKAGLRRERTVSIGFARRCAAARTVSIGRRRFYSPNVTEM